MDQSPKGPVLARLYSTEPSLQKEDSDLKDGNGYVHFMCQYLNLCPCLSQSIYVCPLFVLLCQIVDTLVCEYRKEMLAILIHM